MNEMEKAQFRGAGIAIIIFSCCIFLGGLLFLMGIRFSPDNDIVLHPGCEIILSKDVKLVNYPRSGLPFERGIRIETDAWAINIVGVNHLNGTLELTTDFALVISQLDYYGFKYEVATP